DVRQTVFPFSDYPLKTARDPAFRRIPFRHQRTSETAPEYRATCCAATAPTSAQQVESDGAFSKRLASVVYRSFGTQ
ncbi:MAG: hypothetical protein WBW56_11110, partial [Syntrophobacteraceae bacterium]